MERREYACGNCGAVYMGYYNPDSIDRYEPCPECGTTMASKPFKIFTTDSTMWFLTEKEFKESLAKRDKKVHFLIETMNEKEIEYYKEKGLIK